MGRVRGGALWSYVMSKITANTSVVYEITLESVPPIGIARDVVFKMFDERVGYKSIHWHSKRSPFVVPSWESASLIGLLNSSYLFL